MILKSVEKVIYKQGLQKNAIPLAIPLAESDAALLKEFRTKTEHLFRICTSLVWRIPQAPRSAAHQPYLSQLHDLRDRRPRDRWARIVLNSVRFLSAIPPTGLRIGPVFREIVRPT